MHLTVALRPDVARIPVFVVPLADVPAADTATMRLGQANWSGVRCRHATPRINAGAAHVGVLLAKSQLMVRSATSTVELVRVTGETSQRRSQRSLQLHVHGLRYRRRTRRVDGNVDCIAESTVRSSLLTKFSADRRSRPLNAKGFMYSNQQSSKFICQHNT